MKRINNRIGVLVLTMLLAIAIPMVGHSSPPDPGGSPDVPVDGGITLLLAAAGVAGLKKMRENKKKNADKL
jgi:hypothetical protein